MPQPEYLLQAWGEKTSASLWYLTFDFVGNNKAVADSSTIEPFLIQSRERAVDSAAVTFIPPLFPQQ